MGPINGFLIHLNSDLTNKSLYFDTQTTYQQLLDAFASYKTPGMFQVPYTSSLSPDGNTLFGIGIKGMLIAISVGGKLYKLTDTNGWKDNLNAPKMVHTSITGNGSDYYDISCPGIKYGNTVIAQFVSQRNEYYILNADAMADNKVRIIVNKAVPAGTGIYVNAIYSTN